MAIVGGLDIHRRQITYDWIDTDTGQARHGRIQPATRVELRAWLARFAGQQADFAFEGTTGWRRRSPQRWSPRQAPRSPGSPAALAPAPAPARAGLLPAG